MGRGKILTSLLLLAACGQSSGEELIMLCNSDGVSEGIVIDPIKRKGWELDIEGDVQRCDAADAVCVKFPIRLAMPKDLEFRPGWTFRSEGISYRIERKGKTNNLVSEQRDEKGGSARTDVASFSGDKLTKYTIYFPNSSEKVEFNNCGRTYSLKDLFEI